MCCELTLDASDTARKYRRHHGNCLMYHQRHRRTGEDSGTVEVVGGFGVGCDYVTVAC